MKPMKRRAGAEGIGLPAFGRRGRMAVGVATLFASVAAQAATVTIPPVSVGAGMRSSFTHSDFSGSGNDDVNDFNLDSVRLYVSGAITDSIKLMVNTDYDGSDEKVKVIDAVARFEFAPEFNIWAGRFLPPSDRANLYGPYYASNFGVYVDGVQDGWVFEAAGRDDGIAYWGDFDKLKVSVGAFDVPSTKGNPDKNASPNGKNVVGAARIQYDFWDKEEGYYLNGTYYGEKNLLALGASAQTLDGDDAFAVDFLLEKNFAGTGVLTVESEYASYESKIGGYATTAVPAFDKDKGWYGLAAWLFPQQIGPGKFQVLGKYGEAKYEVDGAPDPKQKTTEVDLNYLIKTFNARLTLFYLDRSTSQGVPDVSAVGVGVQVQI